MLTLTPLHWIVILCLICQTVFSAWPALAAPESTYVVDTLVQAADINPGNNICLDTNSHCSLLAAVMEANAHAGADTITLMAGTHTMSQRLQPIGQLIINGAGRDTTTIAGDGSYSHDGFQIEADVTLNNLTLTNFPRAIYISNTRDNHTVTITNSRLTNNINPNGSNSGSAIANYCDTCTVYLTNVDIYGNQAAYCGAISSKGALYLSNSQVHGNQATNTYGGGICSVDSVLDVSQSLVYGNETPALDSADIGGGIFLSGSTASVFLSEVFGNSAHTGGGIYIADGGSFTANNVQIYGNTATGSGGGILISGGGTTLIDSSIIRENEAVYAGGVFVWSSAKIVNSTVISNTASTSGGGFYISDQTLSLVNSTVSGNQSDGNGGGIYVKNSAVAQLANVTVSNNTANADQSGDNWGGGVYQEDSSTIRVKNSIIAGNQDLQGVMFDTYAPDCFGDFTSDGYNLVGRVTAMCNLTGDMTGMQYSSNNPLDPGLGSLTFYAAEYYYHPVLFGAVVDRGNPSGCKDYANANINTDQIGNLRPYSPSVSGYSPRCDLGAIESNYRRYEIFLPVTIRN